MARARSDIPARDTPEAKARRQRKPDPSCLDADAEGRLGLVEFAGLFGGWGSSWKSEFARELSRHAGRTVTPAQVLSWCSGLRPVPADLEPALEDLFHYRAEWLRYAADMMTTFSNPKRELPQPVAPAPEATPPAEPLDPHSPEGKAYIESILAELMESDAPTE
jgi:hypothetical protein